MWRFCLAASMLVMVLQVVIIFKENLKGWDFFEWIMLVIYFAVLLTVAIARCNDD
jgi:hypothetical protein